MTVWLTADQHFGHRNIVTLSGRPFKDVDEMNDVLIVKFNQRVSRNDVTIHLGDISLSTKKGLECISRLNGSHFLVTGNHDTCWDGFAERTRPSKSLVKYQQVFDRVYTSGVYTTPRLPAVVFSHLPYVPEERDAKREERLKKWRPRERGYNLICGHVHEAWRHRRTPSGSKMANVGVDVRNYSPVKLRDVLDEFQDPTLWEESDVLQ